MAVTDNGSFLKGLRGSAVNLTFRGVYQNTVVSGKRKKGLPNPSPEVLQAQSVADQLAAIYRLVRADVRQGFTNKGPNQSAFNAWWSENYAIAFDLLTPPVATFIPGAFTLTRGVMTGTDISSMVADKSANTVTVNWSTVVGDASQNAIDGIILSVYNVTQDKWYQISQGANRSAGTVVGTVPSNFMEIGDSIYAYLGFIANDDQPNAGISSTSRPGTTTVVA